MAEDHHPIYQEISSFHREAQAEGHLSHVSVHRVEWENNPPRLTLQVFCRDSHFDEPLEVTCRFPNDLSGEIYFESGNVSVDHAVRITADQRLTTVVLSRRRSRSHKS